MRNIEKYKNNIAKAIDICELYQYISKIECGKYVQCGGSCDKCYDDCIRWLAKEYKEPILDEVERKYLSDVTKPFRKKVNFIVKMPTSEGHGEYLCICTFPHEQMFFPTFKESTMYRGMKFKKHYTLEELGL